uniref:Ferric-chelate reductase 1 n=1 Tax=Anthurium amnicola TaxID=1678845 RepID=A0A1D1XJT0_9ARAE
MAGAGRRGGPPNGRPFRFSALALLVWAAAAAVSTSGVDAQSDACGSDLSSFLPAPFNGSGFNCRPLWNNFVLRYSQSQDYILSIVLSATYTSGWVGIGFSRDGMMVGSSAMVGWISREDTAVIRQFYLGGQSSSQVVVNKGQLQATNVKPAVVLYGPNIYLAFQVQFSAPITQQDLLFAYSAATPLNYKLRQHDDKTSIRFDFSAGTASASSYPHQLKRNHGALAIFGWGVLLPIGAIVARYFKQWDPLWYCVHVVIQFAGFIIGLAAVVAGLALYHKLHANVPVHRGLGIFVFVLGILQVIAFFLRPDKDSKIRRYWNWYHHWVGRIALFLAAVNIILGIRVGGAGTAWKVGYGINLAFILTAVTVLEIILWVRWSRKSVASPTF